MIFKKGNDATNAAMAAFPSPNVADKAAAAIFPSPNADPFLASVSKLVARVRAPMAILVKPMSPTNGASTNATIPALSAKKENVGNTKVSTNPTMVVNTRWKSVNKLLLARNAVNVLLTCAICSWNFLSLSGSKFSFSFLALSAAALADSACTCPMVFSLAATSSMAVNTPCAYLSP